jgi:hypothetical protein
MRQSSRFLNVFKSSAVFMLLAVSGSIQAQDSKQAEIPVMGFFVN